MKNRKVLVVSTVGLIYDGITSVIISYLEAMDLSGLDIRLVGTIKVEPKIREKVESLGCTIVDLPNRRNETLKYFNKLRKYIRKEKIEVVHAHGNSATLAVDLLAAKLGGCKKRIAHSHNTKCDQVKADILLRPLFYHLYTDALACGQEAGEWLFGNRSFTVLRNGRDVEKYRFNPSARQRMRNQYSLKDELLIGHVGGFVEQKNHVFLIKVFREVLKKKPDAKLVLVGDGILRNSIENSVSDISDSVLFIGNTDHVEDYLNMMDVMVLPSLFEGLPLVMIEWQINGLPCVVSNAITKECILTEQVKVESLQKEPYLWALTILSSIDINSREANAYVSKNMISLSQYNIDLSAVGLRNIYTE